VREHRRLVLVSAGRQVRRSRSRAPWRSRIGDRLRDVASTGELRQLRQKPFAALSHQAPRRILSRDFVTIADWWSSRLSISMFIARLGSFIHEQLAADLKRRPKGAVRSSVGADFERELTGRSTRCLEIAVPGQLHEPRITCKIVYYGRTRKTTIH